MPGQGFGVIKGFPCFHVRNAVETLALGEAGVKRPGGTDFLEKAEKLACNAARLPNRCRGALTRA